MSVTIILIYIFYGSAVFSQDSVDHEQHHPQANEEQSDQSLLKSSDQGSQSPMAGMMDGMHGPPPRDLYPRSFSLAPGDRDEIERLQRDGSGRMDDSIREMSRAIAALKSALDESDDENVIAQTRALEAATARFRSGAAARLASSSPELAQATAQDWFRREMNFPVAGAADRLYWGLSPLHLIVMAVLLLFSTQAFLSYIGRVRRTSALLNTLRAPKADGTEDGFKGVLAHPRNAPPEQNPTTPISKREHWIGGVKVIGVHQETHNVKTFRLALSDQSPLPFAYEPGQFCTVTAPAGPDGSDISRSYTIASSPTDRDAFELTIKREDQGQMSRHLHDKIDVGSMLKIKAPLGRFYFNGEQSDQIALVAGGVGVTPMMSALRYLTAHRWPGRIAFLYFAKAEQDIIFHDELMRLADLMPNVSLNIWLSEPSDQNWVGRTGMVSADGVKEAVPDIANFLVHVCGPQPMMDATKRTMLELGVAKENFKMESFGDAANAPPRPPPTNHENAKAYAVSFARTNASIEIADGQTVLEAADLVNAPIDRSCLAGTCGACIVKLLQGEVHMDVDDALEPDEIADGYILACQAHPKSKLSVDA